MDRLCYKLQTIPIPYCCRYRIAAAGSWNVSMFPIIIIISYIFGASSICVFSTALATVDKSTILYKSRDYHLLEIVPHSTSSFTQGLTHHDGYLYEGTGLEYRSTILLHDPSNNMETLHSMEVRPTHLFGEGITHYFVDKEILVDEDLDGDGGGEKRGRKSIVREERIIQLTWKDKVALIYRIVNQDIQQQSSEAHADVDGTDSLANKDSEETATTSCRQQPSATATTTSLELIDQFEFKTHTGEGWGITFIPHTNEFYVTDGSEYILVWDAQTLQEKRRLAVTLERGQGDVVRLKYLNELEFVDFAQLKKKVVIGGDSRSQEEEEEVKSDNNNVAAYAEYIPDVYLEQQCQETNDGVKNDDQTCSSSSTNVDDNSNEERGFTSTMSILANVWYQDVLISIDPVTGKVTRVYDLSDIYPHEQRRKDGADCLNGISVTTRSKDDSGEEEEEEEGLELWVTGKLWPKMYRIRLID